MVATTARTAAAAVTDAAIFAAARSSCTQYRRLKKKERDQGLYNRKDTNSINNPAIASSKQKRKDRNIT